MHNFYQHSETGKYLFFAVSIILVGIFLYISNDLVKKLAQEERNKMEIWAAATRELATETSDGNIDLILKIIQSNTTIPVIITDENGMIAQYLNIDINTSDTTKLLSEKLADFKNNNDTSITIDLGDGMTQTLYYDDSILLKRLSYYPYIQLAVMILFALIAYIGLVSVKRAEQNKVWVGLSKETAHQLGTPISSLMAWIELLKASSETESGIAEEIEKDVKRLSTIADRFSKIGSMPQKEKTDINSILEEAATYMQHRISGKIDFTLTLPEEKENAMLCKPLIEWVIENLCKNAVDAMEGKGKLNITAQAEKGKIYIEISDTGKGIAKKNFNTIFKPGYTTKKRGWGLGLTLAKRIVEEYHNGAIYVKESTPGIGTTFRIELPRIA